MFYVVILTVKAYVSNSSIRWNYVCSPNVSLKRGIKILQPSQTTIVNLDSLIVKREIWGQFPFWDKIWCFGKLGKFTLGYFTILWYEMNWYLFNLAFYMFKKNTYDIFILYIPWKSITPTPYFGLLFLKWFPSWSC